MKKKALAVIGALSLIIGMSVTPINQVKAAEPETVVVDGSMLMDVDESVGESLAQTRGTYLQKGISNISKVGTGKIKVGGTTIAQKVVSEIGLSVMVERLSGSSWVSYTSWSVYGSNTYTLTSSKTLTVPRGYYYRVRCIHSANTDNSSSNTSGIYVD